MGNARNIAFWVVLFLLILALFNLFSGGQTTMSSRALAYSDFLAQVDKGEVARVTIDGERVDVVTQDNSRYVTITRHASEADARKRANAEWRADKAAA